MIHKHACSAYWPFLIIWIAFTACTMGHWAILLPLLFSLDACKYWLSATLIMHGRSNYCLVSLCTNKHTHTHSFIFHACQYWLPAASPFMGHSFQVICIYNDYYHRQYCIYDKPGLPAWKLNRWPACACTRFTHLYDENFPKISILIKQIDKIILIWTLSCSVPGDTHTHSHAQIRITQPVGDQQTLKIWATENCAASIFFLIEPIGIAKFWKGSMSRPFSRDIYNTKHHSLIWSSARYAACVFFLSLSLRHICPLISYTNINTVASNAIPSERSLLKSKQSAIFIYLYMYLSHSPNSGIYSEGFSCQ